MFGGRKKNNQEKQSGVELDKALKALRPKYAGFARSKAFANPSLEAVGALWREAYPILGNDDGLWTIRTVSFRPAPNGDGMIEEYDDYFAPNQGVCFVEAMYLLTNFERSEKDQNPDAEEVEGPLFDINDHYMTVCAHEGLAFDEAGQPHLVKDGHVRGVGRFSHTVLQEVREKQGTPLPQTPSDMDRMTVFFNQISDQASQSQNFDVALQALSHKGKLTRFLNHIEEAYAVLRAYEEYFALDAQGKAAKHKELLDMFLRTHNGKSSVYYAALSGTYKKYGLNPRHIMASPAFNEAICKSDDAGQIAEITQTLQALAEKSVTHKSYEGWANIVNQAAKLIKELIDLEGDNAKNTAPFVEVHRRMVLCLAIFSMRLRYETLSLMAASVDISHEIDKLKKNISEVVRLAPDMDNAEDMIGRMIVGPGTLKIPQDLTDQIAALRGIIEGAAPQITEEQLTLPLSGGEQGLLLHKNGLPMEAIKQEVLDIKRREDEKERDRQLVENMVRRKRMMTK